MFCQSGYQAFSKCLKMSSYDYLEIGVFNGDSVAGLARQFPSKIIYGIDPFIEDGYTTHTSNVERGSIMSTQKQTAHNNTKDLSNVVLFETCSIDFATMLTDEMVVDMNVGWVLIDGSHHYNDVVVDMHLAMRLIGERAGGIVFDDVNVPEVGQAYQEWLEIYKDQIGPVSDIYLKEPGHILFHPINTKG